MAKTAAKPSKEKTVSAPQTKTPPAKAPEQAQQPSPAAPPAPATTVADAPSAPSQAPAAGQAPGKPATGVRMPAINDVRVAGRLTDEPQIKAVGRQNVANFRVAVEKKYLDAQNVWQKQVSFVPVALWGAVADRAKGFLHKGAPVYLEGRLRTSSWQTRDGQNRSMLRLEAFKVQSLAKGQSQSRGQEIGD